MSNTGTTDFGSNRIDLGTENPAFDDGRTYASGINIHKPGINNKTGMTTSGQPISPGCSLIDRNSCGDFIGIFNTPDQKNNVISVTMSRTMASPSNVNVPKVMHYNFRPSTHQTDALKVVLPYRR